MAEITIRMQVSDELADSTHDMGVTNEGFEAIFEALSPYGDDINIQKGW